MHFNWIVFRKIEVMLELIRTIEANFSFRHQKKFRRLQRDSNLGPYDAGAMLYLQLSYKATQLGADQFVGLMCARERTDEGNNCLFEVRVTHNSSYGKFCLISIPEPARISMHFD